MSKNSRQSGDGFALQHSNENYCAQNKQKKISSEPGRRDWRRISLPGLPGCPGKAAEFLESVSITIARPFSRSGKLRPSVNGM